MKKFQLELLFQLIGIGSASGLLFKDHSLFLISDNGGYLYEYNIDGKPVQKTALLKGEFPEIIAKKAKPDFESITSYGDDYFIFGSGSTENRNKMVQYNTKTRATETIDLTNLYLSMQSFGEIKPEDFNIEGVVFNGDNWFFFHRGNGSSGKNAVFTVGGKDLENEFSILFNKYKLPKIKGVQSSFTDAVFVDDAIYFLASAEDTQSTYDDGEVLGSLIGKLNVATMKIEMTKKISDKHKFEGLTLYKKTDSQIEFLLCEDNDTETLESAVYKLILQK